MKGISRLIGISALAVWALTACGGAVAEPESDEPGVRILTRSEAASLKGTVEPQGVTCTDSYGVCRVGRCEFPVDDFQSWTHTCCDSLGNCTATQWRICGCVEP